jgi:hypothetical protein
MNQLMEAHPTTKVNRNAVALAAVAACLAGVPEWIGPGTTSWEVVLEAGRTLVLVHVLARLSGGAIVSRPRGALAVAAGACVFQAAILSGSLIHEHMPLAAYLARAGHVVLSTLVATFVLAWRARGTPDPLAASGEPSAPRRDAGAAAAFGVTAKTLVLAALAAVLVGALWYSPLLFGGAWARLKAGASAGGATLPAVEGFGELVRSGIVAYVMGRVLAARRVVGWKRSIAVGSAVWFGFHATLLLYSLIHQGMPLGLFAIHAGHGLANDLVIATIVGSRRRTPPRSDRKSG